MAGNKTLANAKAAKNDEFYTQLADIEREVNAYLAFNPDVFRDKTVLLPCDDPEWSNFTRFFAQNFSALGLRRLVSTGYAIESKRRNGLLPGFLPDDGNDPSLTHGKILTLDRDTNGNGVIDLDDIETGFLEGDGDFRSAEVCALRDASDVVVTNPPFSLFREFIPWIMKAEKHFLAIGSLNSVSHKEIFPFIQQERIWLGAGFANGDAYFGTPSQSRTDYSAGVRDEESGIVKFRNCCWYTNLDHGQRHEPLQCLTWDDNVKYSRHREVRGVGYARYENYDAIEVPYVDAIPGDYEGVMGVPRSFLSCHNPEQFEIVGIAEGESGKELGLKPVPKELKRKNRSLRDGQLYFMKDGEPVKPYARILIRKRKDTPA